MYRIILTIFAATVLLTACSAGAGPEKVVEKYFQAITEKDATQLSTIACSAWEAEALMFLDSFQAVSTRLESLSCQQTGTTADGMAIVSCAGNLIASYDGEALEIDLSVQEYLVQNVNGDWLVCGIK